MIVNVIFQFEFVVVIVFARGKNFFVIMSLHYFIFRRRPVSFAQNWLCFRLEQRVSDFLEFPNTPYYLRRHCFVLQFLRKYHLGIFELNHRINLSCVFWVRLQKFPKVSRVDSSANRCSRASRALSFVSHRIRCFVSFYFSPLFSSYRSRYRRRPRRRRRRRVSKPRQLERHRRSLLLPLLPLLLLLLLLLFSCAFGGVTPSTLASKLVPRDLTFLFFFRSTSFQSLVVCSLEIANPYVSALFQVFCRRRHRRRRRPYYFKSRWKSLRFFFSEMSLNNES